MDEQEPTGPFFAWCKKRNINPFPEAEQAEPADTDAEAPKPVKSEGNSTKRAAVRSHAYPPLYGRGQYPDAYFRPIAADAPVYQQLDGAKGRTK